MRILKSFSTLLARLQATQGSRLAPNAQDLVRALDWEERVRPVVIIDDLRGIVAPIQRRLFWERFSSQASSGQFQAMGFYSTDRPLRVEYFEIVKASGPVLFGMMQSTFIPTSGFGTPVRPIEGQRNEAVVTQVWSQETGSSLISGPLLRQPRVIDWAEGMKPVIFPRQTWGAQTVTGTVEGDFLECIMAWSELDDDTTNLYSI